MAAPPSLEVHADAIDLIREKGGSVYVWADSAGMKHVHPAGTRGIRSRNVQAPKAASSSSRRLPSFEEEIE
jgi:hypothetical protein